MIIDHAKTTGLDGSDSFHLQVEPMDGCGVIIPVGMHRAASGLHDEPTPSYLLWQL